MGIAPQQWVLAFIVACALHVLGAGLILAAQNAPSLSSSPPAPHGVMVSLDSLMAQNPAQLDTATKPEPVAPAPIAPAAPTPVASPAAPIGISPTPTPIAPSSPTPIAPQSTLASPSAVIEAPRPGVTAPATTTGAPSSAQTVKVPIANAVTVRAADTPQQVEQATTLRAMPSTVPTAKQAGENQDNTDSSPTRTYINNIRGWLGSHKYYPDAARASGAEGTVRLYLIVDRTGHVLHISVARSSGNPALDQAAMDMVKRSEPLPAMTENMLRTRLEVILPVHFTLTQIPSASSPTTR